MRAEKDTDPSLCGELSSFEKISNEPFLRIQCPYGPAGCQRRIQEVEAAFIGESGNIGKVAEYGQELPRTAGKIRG